MRPRDCDLHVREFRKSDLSDVLNIAGVSFAREFEVTGFDQDRIKKIVDQMFGILGRFFLGISGRFGKESFKLFVAEICNRVVGMTMITNRGKVGYISTVMVHPDHRRQGIAKKLVNAALEYAQRRKMRRAVLHVIPTNLPAKNLYSKLGFKEFEKTLWLAAKIEWISAPEDVKGIKLIRFRRSHTNAVYHLIRSSEDPQHLDVFDINRGHLETTILERIFHFATVSRIVAICDNRLIGYAEATYTTSEEAGQIDNVQVSPEMKGRGIEEMLIFEATSEVRKLGTKKIVGTASTKRPELTEAMRKLGFEKNLELEGMFVELK